MEILRWVGTLVAAIAVLIIIGGLGAIAVAIVLVGGAIIAVVGILVLMATAIKEYFES